MIVPAMGTNFANPDGTVSERLKDYFAARARGGFALIITEGTAVNPDGRALPLQLGIWDDSFIAGFRDLAKMIHAEGAKIAVQLFHVGRETNSHLFGRPVTMVAPSAIPCPVNREMPKELSIEEIQELEEEFAEGARRAKEAEIDAVEIHGAHGYLVSGFMSSYSNRRTDAYGGSLEGLLRFPIEVIHKIRRKVGSDFPISFRLSAEERVPRGRTIQETKAMIPFLEEAGVDAFHVSTGVYGSHYYIIPPMAVPPGFNVSAASEIKKVTSKPIIAVGRINNPYLAEQILREGQADLVAMGRASLADPELPNKVASENCEDIRWCIGCNQGCIDRLFGRERYMSCLVNPAVGREREMALTPAPQSKKVLVVGGGPGGMETARVAALRGHQVYLYEKEEKLGGHFNLAAIPPCKQDIAKAINYLSTQIKKAGVKITLGKEVTEEIIEEIQPEVIVFATGGTPVIPDIPGVQQKKVVTAIDILRGKVMPGRRVLMTGGGMIGCETADFLGQLRGCEVTLVEMLPKIARDVGEHVRYFLLQRLAQENVRIITSASVKRINEDGVILKRNGREEKLSGFDTIVLALGVVPMNDLAKKIQSTGVVKETYVIGDAKQARKAIDAIAEAAEIGRKI
jgi:2,4-dienoyl-CoA reductase-like NADH-dependent reductase (Old Yellow Enzyme family)/thioredoxin reductase